MPWIALGAGLVIATSLGIYAATAPPTADRWQASRFDAADYRYTAEYFWGVPHVAGSYEVDDAWRGFLETLPFRGVGLGTLYLLAALVRVGHVPASPGEVLTAGLALAAAEKACLVMALAFVFLAARRCWGTAAAFGVLGLLAFPPRLWRLTDDLMTEPVLRILFLLLFGCALWMEQTRTPVRLAGLMVALVLACAMVKAEWVAAAALLVPLLLDVLSRRGAGIRPRAAILVRAAFVPAALICVNWIGWRTPAVGPGVGLHVNLKYAGEVVRAFCREAERDPSRPAICHDQRPRHPWWHVYVGPDNTKRDYAALDAYATRWIRDHPWRALREFANGLLFASVFPGGNGVAHPEGLLVDLVDFAVWVMLGIGLCAPETRLVCGVALILWLVPAIGNVFSLYETARGPRYHLPMVGIAPAAACGVIVRARVRLRRLAWHVPAPMWSEQP